MTATFVMPDFRVARSGQCVRRLRGAVALTALFACAGITVISGTYASVDEARRAGAEQRGWIPPGLPDGASDLRIAYLDGDHRWGLFSFPGGDAEALRALLGGEISGAAPPCDPPGRLEWWPRVLRTPVGIETLHATNLRVYAAKDGRLTYAVNWNQGQAYYWRG